MLRAYWVVPFLLCLFQAIEVFGNEAATRQTLQLSSQPLDRSQGRAYGGLLVRELGRQAVLLSARGELGLSTRDQSLRDVLDVDETTLDLNVRPDAPHGVQMTLLLRGRQEPLLEALAPLPSTPNHNIVYDELIEHLERLTRGAIPDALGSAGFQSAEPRRSNAQVDDETERLLSELSELSQFAAVRRIHGQIRRDGESPALLGALVRGYANLGQMTRYHWTVSGKAYAARSLLYAQRMVAADPHSPQGLWHRAYAKALAGLHASALADLELAEALRRDRADDAAEPPDWVMLLEPLCHYNTGRLADLTLTHSSLQELGTFLCFLTVEHCGSQSTVIEFARLGLMVNPGCLRLVDAICDVAGAGYMRWATEVAPAMFRRSLPEHLRQMPQLPPPVRRIVERGARPGGNPHARLEVVQALIEAVASDDGEPSWAVLGEMIQEITFIHTYRRADLIVNMWRRDASEFVTDALPLLEGHPYRGIIQAYGQRPATAGYREALKDVDLVDVSPNMRPAVGMTYETDTPGLMQAKRAWDEVRRNHDFTAWEVETRVANWRASVESRLFTARQLLGISPYAPQAMAALIEGE